MFAVSADTMHRSGLENALRVARGIRSTSWS